MTWHLHCLHISAFWFFFLLLFLPDIFFSFFASSPLYRLISCPFSTIRSRNVTLTLNDRLFFFFTPQPPNAVLLTPFLPSDTFLFGEQPSHLLPFIYQLTPLGWPPPPPFYFFPSMVNTASLVFLFCLRSCFSSFFLGSGSTCLRLAGYRFSFFSSVSSALFFTLFPGSSLLLAYLTMCACKLSMKGQKKN